MLVTRPELVFVSPRFLFPADSGGAIRTTEILRNMRGGKFRICLLSPATPDQQQRHAVQLADIADQWHCWPASATGTAPWRRWPLLMSNLPLSVASDRSTAGTNAVAQALARHPRVAVFDFLHSAVLAQWPRTVPSVLFTHNVEAEIVERHLQHSTQFWKKALWRSQLAKMRRYESETVRRFDRVVAVSARDAERFKEDYGADRVDVIPTGVNLEYFHYVPSESNSRVVFTGSMDWLANIDAIRWYRAEVWPRIKAEHASATMTVVGRNPPPDLSHADSADWTITGRVDDIRPHVHRAAVYVIPMRIGGGTRIKAYEAMAMGVPVVSTVVGMEGLDVQPGSHYLQADTAEQFAQAVASLLSEPQLGRVLAERARRHVEERYSNATVAREFEKICERAIQ
ncbi:MAG: glycosyltransferase family 4 protein [Burkholderiaceae bacterium]